MNKDFVKTIKIQENQSLCIINMPVHFREELLNKLPEGVIVTSRPIGEFNTVILFTNTKEELTLSWDRLFNTLVKNGNFWIAYPDKKSGLYNEISKTFIDDFMKEKNITTDNVTAFLSDWKTVKITKPGNP